MFPYGNVAIAVKNVTKFSKKKNKRLNVLSECKQTKNFDHIAQAFF